MQAKTYLCKARMIHLELGKAEYDKLLKKKKEAKAAHDKMVKDQMTAKTRKFFSLKRTATL